MLIQGLPADSALWRHQVWTRTEEFLATLIELGDIASRRTVMSMGGEVKGDPIRVPRPEPEQVVPQRKRITTDSREIARWFSTYH